MQLLGRSLIESVRSDVPLRGHNYGVYASSITSYDAPLNSVHVSTSRCDNTTTIHIPGEHAYALCPRCDNPYLGQDCRMVTC